MQPKLTPREEVVLSLSALGFQPEEIEDYINSDTGTKPKANTNRKHIANAKSKIGWHKAAEIAGWRICKHLGADYEAVRREILKEIASKLGAVLLLLILLPYELLGSSEVFRRSKTGKEIVSECSARGLRRTRREPNLLDSYSKA